jgi:hypothetical protein
MEIFVIYTKFVWENTKIKRQNAVLLHHSEKSIVKISNIFLRSFIKFKVTALKWKEKNNDSLDVKGSQSVVIVFLKVFLRVFEVYQRVY